jgi:gamma-glutamylputrescine oxidase
LVGTGFTGIATALTLAERGCNVTVLEQHRAGWGASGRCGGQMIGGLPGEARLEKFWGDTRADTLFELGYRGHDIIARRMRQYTIDCDLKYGCIDVALKSRQLEQQKQWYEALCTRVLSTNQHFVVLPAPKASVMKPGKSCWVIKTARSPRITPLQKLGN